MIKLHQYYVYIHKKTNKEYTLEDLQKKHKVSVGKKFWGIVRHQYTREIRSKFMEA